MRMIHFGIGLVLVLLSTTGSYGDPPSSATREMKPKIRTDAQLLHDLREAVGAIEGLQRELHLFDADREAPLSMKRVLPREAPRQLPDAQPGPTKLSQEVNRREIPQELRAVAEHLRQIPSAEDRIDIQNLELLCVKAWQAIGAAQARLGDMNAAHQSWRKAVFEGSSCLNAEENLLILRNIALDQLAVGDQDAALGTLFAVRNLRLPRVSARHALRFSLMIEGSFEQEMRRHLLLATVYDRMNHPEESKMAYSEAIRAAEAIENPLRKVSALVAVAEAQRPVDANSVWERATGFAFSLPDALEKTTALESILRSRYRRGDHESVLGVIGDGLKGDLRAYLLWVVADELATGEHLPAAGTVARVLRLAEKAEFDRPSKKKRVFAMIALAQAKLGDDCAFRTLEANQPDGKLLQIVDLMRELNVMCALSRAYFVAGKQEAAKDTVRRAVKLVDAVLGDYHRMLPVADLVRLQAQTGDLRGALRTAERVEHGPSKIAALAAVATAQGKAGDRTGAQATLAEARTALESVCSEEMWQYTESSRAERVFRVGSQESPKPSSEHGALIYLAQQTKAKALHSIASAQLAIGTIDGALETAGEISQCGEAAESELVAVYGEIVASRIEVRDFGLAGKVIGSMEGAALHAAHALRRNYFQEIAKEEIRLGKPPALLRFGIELENRKHLSDKKLEIIRGYAEGLVAFKNSQPPATKKLSEAKPAAR